MLQAMGLKRVRHDLAIEQLLNCSEKTLSDGAKANMGKCQKLVNLGETYIKVHGITFL